MKKDFLNAIVGLAVLAAFALCVIGATGYLLYDGHYLFAVAELVVAAFAARPMFKIITTRLLC